LGWTPLAPPATTAPEQPKPASPKSEVPITSGRGDLTGDGLLIAASNRETSLSRAELLARPDLRELTVQIPGVAAPAKLAAIPLRAVLPSLLPGAAVEVACADGFVAVLSGAEIENANPVRPIAYLAVERDGQHFPSIQGKPTGPYMVVWLVPDAETVPRELWPYRVTQISLAAPLDKRYPRLIPADSKATAGFRVFAQNCLPCHTLNGEGPAHVGPDLNIPHSPVEYLGDDRLRSYVRDPQSLHSWPGARMPAFPASVLSDWQLADLLAYFHERAAARR
jgi:cytochrome c2